MSLLKKIEFVFESGAPKIIDFRKSKNSFEHLDFSSFKGKLVFWPLNNSKESILHLLSAIQNRVVPIILSNRLNFEQTEKIKRDFPSFGFFDGNQIIANAELSTAPQNVFLALFTSGSTGEPKIVAATEDALEKSILAINKSQNLNDVKSTAVTLPLFYSYAFVNQLLWSIYFEQSLILTRGFTFLDNLFIKIQNHNAEMLCLVNSQIKLVPDNYNHLPKLDCVKVINFAGGYFPIEEFNKLRDLFPNAKIINNYGCTEAMPRLTNILVDDENYNINNVGKRIPGKEIRAVGNPSEIEFRGNSVSIGNINKDGFLMKNPEWIKSGDFGHLENGCLIISGRADQIVKIRGERISTVPIEQKFLDLEGISNSIVFPFSDGKNQDILCAVISGEKFPAKSDIQKSILSNLEYHSWLSKIYWIEEWPLNNNNKTDRFKIQNLAIQNKLKTIWDIKDISL